MKSITLDRVKQVVQDHAPTIVLGRGIFSAGMYHTELLRIARYLAGGEPMTFRQTATAVIDELRTAVQAVDVRCVGDLLRLVPQGYDNRLPGWLYGDVDASLEDEGWVLYPRRAA